MTRDIFWVRITIGTRSWRARLRRDLAPASCARLEELLPYRGRVLHARWSGEAFWAPLTPVWPAASILAPESAEVRPKPGDILLFAGTRSEPELLFPYGACRFACKAGALAGNPVLSLEDPPGVLADIGEDLLRSGAMDLSIEPLPSTEAPHDAARPT